MSSRPQTTRPTHLLDAALRLMARPGQTVSTDFVLERAAVYQFQCAIQDHRDVGMVATFTVTPAR